MASEINELYKTVLDSKLELEDKKELLDEIRKLTPAAENRWNFRYVIWALAIVAISAPLYFIAAGLLKNAPNLPEAMIALSSTAVGALAGYISSSLQK